MMATSVRIFDTLPLWRQEKTGNWHVTPGVGKIMTRRPELGDMPLTTVIHYSPIASVVTDPRQKDNPIVACNAAFIGLTGYGEDEILGRNCRFLSGPRTEPWLTERIKSAVADRKPVLVEILNYRKDGTPFRNAVLVAPVYDLNGELANFLGSQVEIPIAEPVTTAARQTAAVERIQQLSPRQRQVLGEMAHGRMNKQIAYQLNLSEKTIKMHRAMLIANLGVATTADAVRLAVEAGL
jgi:PAS domain S-box-containing protein